MTSTRKAAVLLGFMLLGGAAWAYQARRSSYMYEREMQNPAADPDDADVPGEWAFARLRYRAGGGRGRGWGRGSWGTDSNKAERVFTQGVRRLTRLNARSVEEIIDVDSDEVFNWPWL